MSLSTKATEQMNGEELFKQTQPLGRAMKLGVKENRMHVTLTKSKQWLDNLKFLVRCLEGSMVIEDEKLKAYQNLNLHNRYHLRVQTSSNTLNPLTTQRSMAL